MLSVPNSGMARKALGRKLPYAAVTQRDGWRDDIVARNSCNPNETRLVAPAKDQSGSYIHGFPGQR